VEEPDDLDTPAEAPLEALYDAVTLRRLGVATPPAVVAEPDVAGPDVAGPRAAGPDVAGPRAAGPVADGSHRVAQARSSAMALALTAALTGVREALEVDESHVVEAEVDPGWEAFGDRPVQFVAVWGDPEASLVLVRPWLSAR
jgi:hypothetical protein